MEESNWIKSAARFAVVAVILGAILFGGIYFLKNRHDIKPNNTPAETSKPSSNKSKSSNSKSSKENNKSSKTSSNGTESSRSPKEVAPAGASEYWYIPVLGVSVLAFVLHEYWLSRKILKRGNFK